MMARKISDKYRAYQQVTLDRFAQLKASGENVVIDVEYFYEYCTRMANSLENLYQKIRADNQQ